MKNQQDKAKSAKATEAKPVEKSTKTTAKAKGTVKTKKAVKNDAKAVETKVETKKADDTKVETTKVESAHEVANEQGEAQNVLDKNKAIEEQIKNVQAKPKKTLSSIQKVIIGVTSAVALATAIIVPTAIILNQDTKFEIKLNYTIDGLSSDNISISKGSAIKDIPKPQKEGYTFSGWYRDEECTDQYDENDVLKENSQIFAKLEITKYTVTVKYKVAELTDFDAEDGELSDVAHGRKINELIPDDVVGYHFVEWYKDETLQNKYSDDDVVTSDMTIYAKMEINKYTVKFYNGENVISTQTVKHGESATAPQIPTKESTVSTNYTFDRWDTDFNSITETTDIHAVYTEITREYRVTFPSGVTVTKADNSTIASGDEIEYGTVLTFTYALTAGYSVTTFTLNGSDIDQGAQVNVTGDINIVFAEAKGSYFITTNVDGNEKILYVYDNNVNMYSYLTTYDFGTGTYYNDETTCGWYTDEKCTIPVSGDIVVSEDTTVYTKVATLDKLTFTEKSTYVEVKGAKSGTTGEVVIPKKYNSLPVTHIVGHDMSNNIFSDTATGVTIPYGVTNIGAHVFYSSNNIAEINLPGSVTTIGECAFGSSNITKLILPESVTSIGQNIIQYVSGVTEIFIPKNVSNISAGMLSDSSVTKITVDSENEVYDSRGDCNAIIQKSDNRLIVGCSTSTIPDSVVAIGPRAFTYCSNLRSIKLDSNITHIQMSAFYGCGNLESITISSNVTNIGGSAFTLCSKLATVTIDSTKVASGLTAQNSMGGLINYATTIYINNDINEDQIGSYVTSNFAERATDVTGYRKFEKATMYLVEWKNDDGTLLQSKYVENGETPVYSGANPSKADTAEYTYTFTGWTPEESAVSSETTYTATFNQTKRSYTVSFSEGVTVTYSEGVLLSGNSVPYGTMLTITYQVSSGFEFGSLTINGSNANNGDTYEVQGNTDIVFTQNEIVHSVTVNIDGIASAPVNVREETNLLSYLAENVTSVSDTNSCGWYLDADCTIPVSATAVITQNISVYTKMATLDALAFTSINDGTAYSVKKSQNITDYVIPVKYKSNTDTESLPVTTIESGGFGYLDILDNASFTPEVKISSVVIPHGITTIETGAFMASGGLKSVFIPSTVGSIGNLYIPLFGLNDGLIVVKVAEGNTIYTSRGNSGNECNAIIEISSNTLIAGCSTTTIPETVVKLGTYCFGFINGLDTIILSNNVTAVGDQAFCGSSVKNITIPNSVLSLGIASFANCKQLESVTFGNECKITEFGNTLFGDCTSLKEITVPASITSINTTAFSGCTNLVTVTIDSATVASGLTAQNSMGGLINYATTIYINDDISDVQISSYITSNYTKAVETDVEGYTKYEINSVD